MVRIFLYCKVFFRAYVKIRVPIIPKIVPNAILIEVIFPGSLCPSIVKHWLRMEKYSIIPPYENIIDSKIMIYSLFFINAFIVSAKPFFFILLLISAALLGYEGGLSRRKITKRTKGTEIIIASFRKNYCTSLTPADLLTKKPGSEPPIAIATM